MQPEHTPTPPPSGHYDFILNPDQPTKRRFHLPGVGGNPFAMKLVILIGGALALMLVATITVNLFFGNKTNLGDVVSLTQIQQEIIRLSDQTKNATDQTIKNAGVTTELSLTTHQLRWKQFLASNGHTVNPAELALKKDSASDQKLTAAQQTGTFDAAYASLMRAQLESYARALQQAHQNATGTNQLTLLSQHFDEVQLLLQQWPAASLGLAYF